MNIQSLTEFFDHLTNDHLRKNRIYNISHCSWSINKARQSSQTYEKASGQPYPPAPLRKDSFLEQILRFARLNEVINLLLRRLVPRHGVKAPLHNVSVLLHNAAAQRRELVQHLCELAFQRGGDRGPCALRRCARLVALRTCLVIT